jgi:tetratricopeptide (TPR) repeat protein
LHGLDYLLQANALEPNNVHILNDISVAYMGMFYMKIALKYINKALKIDPGNALSKNIYNQIEDIQKRWPKGK